MAERFSDRVTNCEICGKVNAYNRIANFRHCHQVAAICGKCKPKFEKREGFIEWLEPTSK